MSLIKCPECGKEISDKANACPNCGNPMNQQPQQVLLPQQEEYLCCPRCGSRELHAEHKGFSGGKALAGALITGGIGLLAGTIGSRDTQITCLKCGKKFKAGEARVVKNPSVASISIKGASLPTKHICSICGYIYDGDMVPAKCPICKAPAEKFQPLNGNNNEVNGLPSETILQKKLTCSICGYIYNGDTPPEKCPICKAPAEKFEMQEISVTPNNSYNNSTSNGCYVATAIYGSYDCPEVWTLRRYRDLTLDEIWYGRLFIKTYYAVSPTFVKYLSNVKLFNTQGKKVLDKWVAKLNKEGYESTPYEDKY